MDRTERKRIERRIAQAERRIARGITERGEKYVRVNEAEVVARLRALLGS